MPLSKKDKDSIIQRYQNRITEHGVTFASMASGSEAKQLVRHHVHTSALRGKTPSILDIGSGLGQFYEYLLEAGYTPDYTGYDIVPEYVEMCQAKYPDASFLLQNIFEDGIEGEFDSIVLSQTLNNRYENSSNMDVMQTALKTCFEHSRVSVSIDMMSKYVDYEHPDLFYYDPREIFDIARSITKRVIIRHDYRPFEFCVQLLHDDVDGYVV